MEEIKIKKTVKEKVKEPITVQFKDLETSNGFTLWHNKGHFYIEDNSFNKLLFSDSFGGCGMQQLYGWSNVRGFDRADALIKAYLERKHSGVGLVICQLGQSNYGGDFEKALIENGFECTIEYDNLQHCRRGTYKQKIYTKNF